MEKKIKEGEEMKYPQYVKQSVARWTKILKDAKKGKVEVSPKQPNIDRYEVCGYCEHHRGCNSCPLFPKLCCVDGTRSNALYWRICKSLEHTKGKTNKRTIAMIEKMLKAVRTDWKGGGIE